MKVLLLPVDGKLPNIALHKLALWHEAQGDKVTWDMPLYFNQADRVYVSTIFTKSRSKVQNIIGLRPDAIVGGTGTWSWYDNGVLSLPAEVEAMKARINYGFTSRGCFRACPFCLVPRIEGDVRVAGDIYDIWDRKAKKITLFDNNILALPDHFEHIAAQVRHEGLSVDFNQGLDIRLVNSRIINILKTLKLYELRFAFDSPVLASIVEEKVLLMRSEGLTRSMIFYVLVGFNTTLEEDLARLDILRRLKCRAYVMRYGKAAKDPRYISMARWANLHWTFSRYSYDDFGLIFGPGKARH